VEVQKKVRSIMLKLRHSGQARMTSYEMKQFESFMDDDLDTPHTLEFIVDLAKTKVSNKILLRCLSILGFAFD